MLQPVVSFQYGVQRALGSFCYKQQEFYCFSLYLCRLYKYNASYQLYQSHLISNGSFYNCWMNISYSLGKICSLFHYTSLISYSLAADTVKFTINNDIAIYELNRPRSRYSENYTGQAPFITDFPPTSFSTLLNKLHVTCDT